MQAWENEKSFARQKFRSSRGRGRRGGYRGGHHGGPAREATATTLESNYFRYEDESEQVEDGVVAPKSQGADLEALLEDAEVQFNQAFYRFRAQLQDITDEVPQLGATNPEQLLAIDLQQLSASLAPLPLHALLGLEPEYLEGVELQEPPTPPQPQPKPVPQPKAVPAATAVPPAKPREPAATTAAVSVTTVAAPAVVHALVPAAVAPVPVPVPVAVPQAAGPSHTATPAADDPAASGANQDDDDLEALLLGRPAASLTPQSRAAALAPDAGRGAGPAVPPVLAAAMAAAQQRSPAHSTVSPPTHSSMGGAAARAAAEISGSGASDVDGQGASQAGPGTLAAVAAGRPVGLQPTRAVLPAASTTVGLPGMRAGGTPNGGGGTVRLGPAVSAGPAVVKPAVPTRTAVPAAPAAALPAARPGAPLAAVSLPPAQRVAVPGRAPGSSAASSPGPGGAASGGASGGVVDDELRLLLGLPATGSTSVAAPTKPPTVSAQVPSRPAAKLAGAPAKASPAPQATTPSQSLDDWLNGL